MRPTDHFLKAFDEIARLAPAIRAELPATLMSMRNASAGCRAGALAERVSGGAGSDPTLRDGIAGHVDPAAEDMAVLADLLPKAVAIIRAFDLMRTRYGAQLSPKGKPMSLGLCQNPLGCPKGAESLPGRRDRCEACYRYLVRHNEDRQCARYSTPAAV